MSTKSVSKSAVGRQAQLPLARAFKISMNSLKIRFWRSMVTAGGIFLGIAFLATVLTQWLMQWPVAPKVDAGYVRLDGQVKGPGDYEAYKPIPVAEGRAAGIPDAVIMRTLLRKGGDTFSLAGVVQGQVQEKRAIKNLARVNKEWVGLQKFEKDLPIYVSILGGLDINVEDAVKAGLPRALAQKAVVASATVKAADMVEIVRNAQGLDPICAATALNSDITPAQAVGAGVPHDLVVKVLAVPPPAPAPAPAAAPAAAPAPIVPAGPPPPKPGTFRGTVLATVLAENPDSWIDSDYIQKLRERLPVYADVANAKDVKVDAAVEAGLNRSVAEKMASKSPTFKGADMVDLLRDQPKVIKPLYYSTALDQDISVGDAEREGVPPAIARYLAGSGTAFKGTALNDAIKRHPTWMNIWNARVKRYAIFDTAGKKAIAALAKTYAITLSDALKQGRDPELNAAIDEGVSPKGTTADVGNIMIVNENGRKIPASFIRSKAAAGKIPMQSGDYVLIPDSNSKYRMWWLVGMSLLVCTVGITNSMLMAVTERFKEIGTMKCLGALDSFVVLLFMLESGMLGICASVMGWLTGCVAMVLIAGFTKGWDVVATVSPLGVFQTFVGCVVAGMILTLFATIAPAWRAANMPAAMALRSEI